MKKIILLSSLFIVLTLSACSTNRNQTPNNINMQDNEKNQKITNKNKTTPRKATSTKNSLANPASAYCNENGGSLKIEKKEDGGEYGICLFEDNRQCEEWALLKGDCPLGGLKITGYDTKEQIYCAITGGHVDMRKNTCKIKNMEYNLNLYMNGKK